MGTLLQRRSISIRADAPAREAAQIMRDQGVGCVLVTDRSGDLLGIVTDRDLAIAEPFGSAEAELPVSELMTPHPATVEETDSVDRAVRQMEEFGVRRLPVIQGPESKRCVGILTLDDLIVARAVDVERLSRVVKSQIARDVLSTTRVRREWRAEAASEARREQTLHLFYKSLAKRTGTSPPRIMEGIAKFVLESLIRRVQYREAAHVISQLPQDLHDELLRQARGPDRGVTLEGIQEKLARDFGFDPTFTGQFLRAFVSALAELTSAGAMEHLRSQLPQEFWSLFPPRERDKAA